MRDSGYEACGTKKVGMREWIIARMVNRPSYMAAIPHTVDDLRAEGDEEGADELERLATEARHRIEITSASANVRRVVGGGQLEQLPTP